MKKQASKPATIHIEDIKPRRYPKPTTVMDTVTPRRIQFLKNLLKVSTDPKWEEHMKFIGENLSGDIETMDSESRQYLQDIITELDNKRVSESAEKKSERHV